MKVYIPQKRSRKGFVFKMKCQVTSDTTHEVMISKEIKVLSYKNLCSGEKVKVNLGFNNDPGILTVENNTLLPYPKQSFLDEGPYMSAAWEVLSLFFNVHNIEASWTNCNFTWGWYDEDTGGWTGCMAGGIPYFVE